MRDEELNKVLYELSVLRTAVENLQRQASALQSLAEGAEAAAEAVSGIGKGSIFQLGAGAMTRADPAGNILVEVGAGVIVEKKPDDAKRFLEQRAAQARAALGQVERNISEAIARARELSEKAEGLGARRT